MLGLVLETALRRATAAGELRKLLGTPDGPIEYLDDDEVLGEHPASRLLFTTACST